MPNKQNHIGFAGGERIAMALFVFLFGLYVLNILIGKAIILFGWKICHIGNVGEFLILLAASVAFIIVALHREAVDMSKRTSDKQ